MNKIMRLLGKDDKRKIAILFMMMIVAAVFETVGIGMIVPFVGIVTNPEMIQQHKVLSYLFNLFSFKSTEAFLIFAVIFLLSVFVVKNLYLLLFQYAQNRVILNQQVKLSKRLFNEYLTKPYTFHLERNSATLLRNLNVEVSKVFQGIIMAGFNLLTEALVISSILVLLLITAPEATITATILLGGSVLIFFKYFRKKITKLGKEQREVSASLIKWVNQGLGASKEVKVLGKEAFFVEAYTKQNQIKANNSMYMKMLDHVPRLFIETLVVTIVLIVMVIIMLAGTETEKIVSTMALFAMAAFRIMPSINRVVSLITAMKYNQPALSVVYDDLFVNVDSNRQREISNIKAPINGKRVYKNEIKLNAISFRYPNQKEYAINGVSLTIPIGKSVAFIGESGSGKTTIVDIILGLFKPEKGRVLVDGIDLHEQKQTWQQKIGYIPQTIYLSDDTIRGNVAFGIEESLIDDNQVWRALEQAQLKEFVESLPDQLNTTVGERGVRLSGGQRQRIGIARALYNDPEILFMDEATSALDNDTEKEIMRAIDGLRGEKTLIIIAHRLSTINNCDIVFKISKSKLISANKRLEQTS
ncbi:ABC transporter ATP-binding protein/permease [Mesobacillus subterraneus]|uniref:ABC transporter ATP-binding protein n=1 Tax=Mesobacillus subterraneus TaxID=285983 RepID=UPI0020420FB0|nr:ABC transporter ATP-binding protein [Mesobacillus subterraneus]MCM3574705.1 ABC transporter ATP-binding protein/permease [Mesobacillus subterraneus]